MRIARTALLIAAVALSGGACEGTLSHRLEYKLAVMDGLTPRNDDDAILHPYISALNVRCGHPDATPAATKHRREVADLAISARRTLWKHFGIEVTTLGVLRGVDRTLPTEPTRTVPCSKVFSEWTRARSTGQLVGSPSIPSARCGPPRPGECERMAALVNWVSEHRSALHALGTDVSDMYDRPPITLAFLPGTLTIGVRHYVRAHLPAQSDPLHVRLIEEPYAHAATT